MKIHLITPQESCNQKRGYKGTADAVRQNLSYLREAPCDYFLILSGDQLYNMDYSQIVKFAKESNADMIVAALPVEEKQAKRMGLLKIDSSLRLFEFYEKPADSCVLNNFLLDASFLQGHTLRNPQANHFLGSMGIYLFKRQVLFKLLEEQGDDFGKDLIPLALKRADSYTYIFKGYWEDIGTIASFYEANLALIKKEYCIDMYDEHYPIFASAHHLPTPFIQDAMIRQAHICQGSIIEAQEIKNSVIGVRTHIKKGTVVHNSVILGNLSYFPYQNSKTSAIGENCFLEKVIIDEDTYIGNNVRLVNKQQLQNYDGDGIYIRDGIIVVTTGSSLPDGFVL